MTMSNSEDKIGTNADALFGLLLAAHEGLDDAQSAALDARLILLLFNELGDKERIEDLIDLARSAM